MSSSILVQQSRAYLYAVAGFRAQSQRPFVIKEADRLTAKIRATFGTFDESDKEKCATVILAITRIEASEAQRKAEINQQRKLEDDRERYEKRVYFEAEARRERDERLRYWFA